MNDRAGWLAGLASIPSLFAELDFIARFGTPLIVVAGVLIALVLVGVIAGPARIFRTMFVLFTRVFYRLRVVGRENIPVKGPCLLVCNHVSYVDGFFLFTAQPRLIRFVVWGALANTWYFRWLTQLMGAIPISAVSGPRALANALRSARDTLRSGEVVCVFAEGQLTRTGNLLRFKRGFEKIIQGVDAPIVPAYLDGVWGSIFSRQGGKFFMKWPKRLRYPVTVSFGEPLKADIAAFELRQKVQELAAESATARKPDQRPLHSAMIRMAARHPFRFCMADSRGTELSYGKTLAATIALSRVFRRTLGPEPIVGVLLPPSVGGSLVNYALLCCGKVPVNLNYTASSESVASCIEQCDIKTVISSPEVLKRVKLTLPFEATAIERIRAQVTRSDRIVGGLAAFVLPAWIVDSNLMGVHQPAMDDLATIIFSSGSTGEPKGVMLTHHNITSNAESVIQVIDPTWRDRVIGLLPLFHSFGFLANLWVAPLVGCGAVFHNNPLDSKEVGELTGKYGGTILLSTPTFLRAYTRKVPTEQFKTLRFVLAGAEKLPTEVAQSFNEKFGVEPLEGYGCTELSPVAAVNVPNFRVAEGIQVGQKPGTVGHPLPCVAAKIVDPDTLEPLPLGADGLLLIKGANVMKGYWEKPELTAKAIKDGWYITGDVAHLDEDGFITITDRLSRFSKIGGEMVPHIKIEEAIRQILNTDEQGAVVIGMPDPSRGERLVVLHPPLQISTEELWQKLNASGLPKLYVPARDAFHEVPELPYLGTGKLDLRRIKEMAAMVTQHA